MLLFLLLQFSIPPTLSFSFKLSVIFLVEYKFLLGGVSVLLSFGDNFVFNDLLFLFFIGGDNFPELLLQFIHIM